MIGHLPPRAQALKLACRGLIEALGREADAVVIPLRAAPVAAGHNSGPDLVQAIPAMAKETADVVAAMAGHAAGAATGEQLIREIDEAVQQLVQLRALVREGVN